MGLFKKIASAMGRFRGNMRILVVGLDNSGKSTLIEHIKPNKVNNALASVSVRAPPSRPMRPVRKKPLNPRGVAVLHVHADDGHSVRTYSESLSYWLHVQAAGCIARHVDGAVRSVTKRLPMPFLD